MMGPFLIVWLSLVSLVRTNPVIIEDNSGGSNLYITEEVVNDVSNHTIEDEVVNDVSNHTLEDEADNDRYGRGNESSANNQDGIQNYADEIENNEMCSDFVKQMTLSYKMSLKKGNKATVDLMEALRLYIQNKTAIAQKKQEAGEDFVYDTHILGHFWDTVKAQDLRNAVKYKIGNHITNFGRTLNNSMMYEEWARSMLANIISRGLDDLASFTLQRNLRNEEASQFEKDAECFYDFMKSDLNYTIAGMSKEDFGNVTRRLAHSLHAIATSKGIKTRITDIALDTANKLKTVDYEEIKNDLFEAIDIISDKIVQTAEIFDRALQLGVWQMALGDTQVPRLDDLILKAIKIIKSDNFRIKHEQIKWKRNMDNVKPAMRFMVDFVFKLSNEVDMANELEAFAATIEEAIGSLNIDGEEIAAEMEQDVLTRLEKYVVLVNKMGSLDLGSLLPLLRYGIENTKSTNDHETIKSLAVNEDASEERVVSGEEDVSVVAEDDSLDDNREVLEGVSILGEEDSSDGHREIVEEDISVLAMGDSIDDDTQEMQVEEAHKDIVEESG